MILAIDCGSTNHKLALFDEALSRRAEASRPVSYSVHNAERVEFEPEFIWQSTVQMIRAVCHEAGVETCQIKRIALTSQANTFTLVSPSGSTVIPFISWMDKRATREAEELKEAFGDSWHQHCSFPAPWPQLQVSKLLWLARNLPRQSLATGRLMSLPTYLAWRLAGLHGTDANLAAMGGLYSLERQAWWKEIVAAGSGSPENCGMVVPIGHAIPAEQGCADLEFPADLQIVFAGNDQTAGAVANGLRDGGLLLTLGTALVAYRFAGWRAGPFSATGCWGPFPRGGYYELRTRNEGCSALDWAVAQLLPGREAEFFRLATTAASGSALFFPTQMFSNGAWSGKADRAAKARAVLEGICFSLRELIVDTPSDRGGEEVAQVIGGGSTNDFWLQMVANVLDRPVQRGRGDNLLGAAMMALPAVAPSREAPQPVIFPEPNQVGEYEKIYLRWKNHSVGSPAPGLLPYADSKPVGAADFYFAINATFRFLEARLGRDGLRRYWTELGTHYFAPVSTAWQRGGLPAVANYWRAFFKAEPGGEVEVGETENAVTLDVRDCPAIKHLRAHGREIVPCFCQHCYFVTEAMSAPAGLTVRVEGGNGTCRQTILPRSAKIPPQDFTQIKEAS